eukprot:TRINITY_DN13844_c0_g1_i1.p1 TRINITY_DN13844_c0_g1~~TRINITY_DN13844_c0_g1_i1.p1  ORF type:complete len:749 (-),score=52.31 TRINITY_DN13844_c0_g1_i1:463-2523(-)
MKMLKIRQSLLTQEGIQHFQALPELTALDIALCAAPGALQFLANNCKKLETLCYGWIQSTGYASTTGSSQNAADLQFLTPSAAGEELPLPKLQKLTLFGTLCESTGPQVTNFMSKRAGKIRRLLQADNDYSWHGGFRPAPMGDSHAAAGPCIATTSDITPNDSMFVDKVVFFTDRDESQLATIMSIPPHIKFPNLRKLEMYHVSTGSYDLTHATKLTHLSFEGRIPNVAEGFPPSLTHISVRFVRQLELAQFMDVLFGCLLDSTLSLELLELFSVTVSASRNPRSYVGHLIKYLKLEFIFGQGHGRPRGRFGGAMLGALAVPGTWLEPLIPPHTRCKTPILLGCPADLLNLFPNHYVGRYKVDLNFGNQPILPQTARTADQTEWLATSMPADSSHQIFATLRVLEMSDAAGTKAEPEPQWLQELDIRMPALHSLKLRIHGSKVPFQLKHRNLTILVLWRNSAKSFSVEGNHLPSLKKLCIFGSHEGGIVVSNFKALTHLSVGEMESSFSCMAVPELQCLIVSGSSGSIKIDAPSLRILSFGRNCESVHFVTAPTLLQSLSFAVSPRAVELVLRVLKRLGKLLSLSNVLDIQVVLNRKFLRKPFAEQQEISTKALASLCKTACGSTSASDLFSFLPKLLSLRLGSWQCSREVQAPQLLLNDPADWHVRGPDARRHLFECMQSNGYHY